MSVSSWIWTRVAVSISYDDNHGHLHLHLLIILRFNVAVVWMVSTFLLIFCLLSFFSRFFQVYQLELVSLTPSCSTTFSVVGKYSNICQSFRFLSFSLSGLLEGQNPKIQSHFIWFVHLPFLQHAKILTTSTILANSPFLSSDVLSYSSFVTVLLNLFIMWLTILFLFTTHKSKLYLHLNCVLILNWIVWNRIIFIKMDLALNNIQRLIYHNPQTTNQPKSVLILNWISWIRTVLTINLSTHAKLNCLKWSWLFA